MKNKDSALTFLRQFPSHLEPHDGAVTTALRRKVTLIWTCQVFIAENLFEVLQTRREEFFSLSEYHQDIVFEAAYEWRLLGVIHPDQWVQSIIKRAPRRLRIDVA